MMFFGRPPRGFREPRLLASDPRPTDLARIRSLLDCGHELDIAIPRKRKKHPLPPTFVLYYRTGCTTKERIGAVTRPQLQKLMRDYDWCLVWQVPDQPLVFSRSAWYHYNELGLPSKRKPRRL